MYSEKLYNLCFVDFIFRSRCHSDHATFSRAYLEEKSDNGAMSVPPTIQPGCNIRPVTFCLFH